MTPESLSSIPYQTVHEEPVGDAAFRVDIVAGTCPPELYEIGSNGTTWLHAIYVLLSNDGSIKTVGSYAASTRRVLEELPDSWVADAIANRIPTLERIQRQNGNGAEEMISVSPEVRTRVQSSRSSSKWKLFRITSPSVDGASDAP